ncbi:hypothetical protein LAZ67_4003230 [Cordylochernes scorpioides]|uniref:Reverse transcriptase domain-containing protein n=1 Tax=Cordylochernes scorpioides TaxID=51811 RepID=A0ABY6KI60_9ARAC|nr:hypothetical protein LAZ67_4003230 [Cordylochernes scorpioides]
MDTTEYNYKTEQLLQDKEVYEELTKDPLTNITKEFNRKLNKIIRTYKLNKKAFENLKAEENNLPNFYGLPKVHKPNKPLRPIVSYAGSPLYPLTKYLSSLISPFQKKLPHTVPNPIVAVETIKNLQIPNNSQMVSFDVESLYTSIPHDEALLALKSFLELHPEIVLPIPKEALIDLLKLCLEYSYFNFKNRFFRQIRGLPMGNPISAALANIFMNEIDKIITESNNLEVLLWMRYIDDVFCITEAEIDTFLYFLYNLKPYLKFTHEIENNKSLAFLDIQLVRKELHIETTIYRKPTHTGNYLNFSSFGPIHNKIAEVKTLSKRLTTHCSNRNIERKEESNIIFKELIVNNYPKKFIKKHFYTPRFPSSNNNNDQSDKRYCSLPYSYGSERIARILKKYNIIATYQSAQNLKQILRHSDTKINRKKKNKNNVIYKIPCKTCPATYIGETSKALKERINQHKAALRIHKLGLPTGFHRHAKAKTSLEDDDVPIDDTTTNLLFTPQEKERKSTRDKVPDFDDILGRSTSTTPPPPRWFSVSTSEPQRSLIRRQIQGVLGTKGSRAKGGGVLLERRTGSSKSDERARSATLPMTLDDACGLCPLTSTFKLTTQKDVKWNWDPDCQQAFTTLKESLTSKPVLHLYQVGLPCRLYCDASTQGIAGILKQVHPDGQVHPVQYFSRALRAHERNYTASELECLAIVESVDKFRIYLTGRVTPAKSLKGPKVNPMVPSDKFHHLNNHLT